MMMHGLAKFKYLHKSHLRVTLMGYMKSRKTSDLLQQNQCSTQYSIQYTNTNICPGTFQPILDSLWENFYILRRYSSLLYCCTFQGVCSVPLIMARLCQNEHQHTLTLR